MSLFKFLWLRRFLRRNTNRIPEQTAELWKGRLSMAYMLLAWNAAGFIAFMVYKGKGDWAKDLKSDSYLKKTPAQQWSETLGIKEAKVFRVSGLNVSSYDIQNNPDAPNEN